MFVRHIATRQCLEVGACRRVVDRWQQSPSVAVVTALRGVRTVKGVRLLEPVSCFVRFDGRVLTRKRTSTWLYIVLFLHQRSMASRDDGMIEMNCIHWRKEGLMLIWLSLLSYLAQLVSTCTLAKELRSSLRKPHQRPGHRVGTASWSRAFCCAVPAVWNSLPTEIRDTESSLQAFQSWLKTHLYNHSLRCWSWYWSASAIRRRLVGKITNYNHNLLCNTHNIKDFSYWLLWISAAVDIAWRC